MADIDGQWDAVVKSPIGEQKSVMTLTSAGDGFTGNSAGPMGSVEITDGKLAGDAVSFTMKMTSPMPMTLNTQATLSGDTMSGTVEMGAFGKFPFNATRKQ